MKKLLLLIIFGLFVNVSLQGQCVPDTTLRDLVNPPPGSSIDTINGETIVTLPRGEVGVAYSEVLYFRIPTDTTVTHMGATVTATVDSIELLGISNLPPSFSLSCSPANCVFLGGSFGCAVLSGTPTTADSIELSVDVRMAVSLGPPWNLSDDSILYTFDGYFLVIEEYDIALGETKGKGFAPKIFPNPASNRVFVEPDVAVGAEFKLQITSVVGRTVYSKTKTNRDNEPLELDISGLSPGVYLYSLSSGDKSYTGRFSVSR